MNGAKPCLPRVGALLSCVAIWLASELPVAAEGFAYDQTILVANRKEFSPTAFVDPYLINPWGIALRPPGAGGHIWVSNAGNASTSLYIGDANGKPLFQDGLKVLAIEGPKVSFEDGLPNVTGQVYNAASDVPGQPNEFPISGPAVDLTSGTPVPRKDTSGPSKFVFVTTDGTINAWRASTAESMPSAVVVKDYSTKGPDQNPRLPFLPAFTGVAMTTDAFTKDADGKKVADNRLYVSDFQNGRIQVFNNEWSEITSSVRFERPATLPPEFSPFNIQCIGDKLYVAYAVVDTTTDEPATDVPDDGAGRVVEYDRDGRILREFRDEGSLNSPWGFAVAPRGFGAMEGKLLVANFGDGTIAAFDLESGAFVDYIRDPCGNVIAIDGIWGLAFGNGVSLGDSQSLYFTAGPNTEQDGIFGRLTVAK